MKRSRGATIIEFLLVALLMGVLVSGTLSMTGRAMQSQAFGSSRNALNSSVSSAMQLLTRDLEEAHSAEVLSATDLRIHYALMLGNGTYDRTVADPSRDVEYYLGDLRAKPDPNGTIVWRSAPTGNVQVCQGVAALQFAASGPGQIDASIQATGANNSAIAMQHRSVLMRNL